MSHKVFIDGRHGTTGLKIDERLSGREGIQILTIPESQRKDPEVKARYVNEADVVFLGLAPTPPGGETDAAARLDQLAGDLPCVFFVHNASLLSGELLDSGENADVDEAARSPLPDRGA